MPEQHNIEYKTNWHSLPRLVGDDYLKTICAFANSHCGELYIGKVDKGKTRGISVYKKFDDSWNIVSVQVPNYKKAKKWLSQHGALLELEL